MVGNVSINFENFSNRLQRFYTHWAAHRADVWGSSEVIVITTPPASDDLRLWKSSAFNNWLMGLEFPEIIMVFMKDEIRFLCRKKERILLELLENFVKRSLGIETNVEVKIGNGIGQINDTLQEYYSRFHCGNVVVGYIENEFDVLKTWLEEKALYVGLTDVTNGLSELLVIKDVSELVNVKRGASVSTFAIKHCVVPKLRQVISGKQMLSHLSLSAEAQKCILNPKMIKVSLHSDYVDVFYPPFFRSGGEYDLTPTVPSNNSTLFYESESVIICGISLTCNNYCSYIARTYFVDATPMQIGAYKVLLKAQEAAIGALKQGNRVSAAYEAALAVVTSRAPQFVDNLTDSFGSGIGLEFNESSLTINAKNGIQVKAGMVFSVSLGFQNLQSETGNSMSKSCSMLLADIVVVTEDFPEVATNKNSKSLKRVVYPFEDGEQENILE